MLTVEAWNRNAISQVVTEGVDWIVDDDGFRKVSTQFAEVLNESLFRNGEAMISVKSMFEVSIVRIYLIQDQICVFFLLES